MRWNLVVQNVNVNLSGDILHNNMIDIEVVEMEFVGAIDAARGGE